MTTGQTMQQGYAPGFPAPLGIEGSYGVHPQVQQLVSQLLPIAQQYILPQVVSIATQQIHQQLQQLVMQQLSQQQQGQQQYGQQYGQQPQFGQQQYGQQPFNRPF
ncbi:hypothetical protein ACIBG8_47195 [Nonomuraea sp. NPDC050556]|uniref:hypothetical protein n=1 Tax=Nonomuraea sp. NPDC050556 TaxID=3364369 RepID=UPI0037AF97E1